MGLGDGSRPTVTVVIPCYKHGHYLGECLASLEQQSRSDWEAVVVDDASPDRALVEEVISSFADARVRLVNHEENRGLAASRNTGFREASAELVLPLDADDLLAPESLECLIGAIDEGEDLDGAYADVQLFGRSEEVLVFHGPSDGKLVHIADTIPGAGTMIRRTLWERLGGYDESDVLRAGREDFEFWMRAYAQGLRVKRVPRPLYRYRVSHTSMSLACRRDDHLVTSYMVEKNAALFDEAGERRRFVARGYARAALARHEDGELGTARSLAVQALRRDPSMSNLRLVARSLLTPETARRLTSGEAKRRVPLLSYPLRGERRYQPFFVIGAARSGTTLLRRILTAHPALHIPPETFALGEVMRGFRRWGRGLSWPELVSLVLSRFEFHPEFHTFELWLGPLVRQLSNLPREERNLAAILDGFYRYDAERKGVSMERWGDKTPLNTLEPGTLEGLREVFPDARFIHLVRDGCDVVHSHLSGGFMRDLLAAGRRWVEMTSRARRFVVDHPRCSIEVRYESLVRHPQSQVERLCEFLGVAPAGDMLSSERDAAALGDVPEWYWHREVTKPIHADNIGKGRRFFSRQERTDLQQVIGGELEASGYQPADAEVSADE